MKRAKLKEPEFWTILKTPYRERDLMDEIMDSMSAELAEIIDKRIIEDLMEIM